MSLDDEDKLIGKQMPRSTPLPPRQRAIDPYQQVRTPQGVIYDEHGAQIGMRAVDKRNRKRILPRDEGYDTNADWLFDA